MSSSGSTLEKLDQFLQLLAAVSEEKCEKVQKLAQGATEAVCELRRELKRYHVEQLAQLVQDGNWESSTEMMENNFPEGSSSVIGVVEEILVLVYNGNDMQNLKRAIEWLEHLAPDLQPPACKALYDLIKFKGHSNEPTVLLLRKFVRTLPDGVLDNVKSQLEDDYNRIIDYEVWVIKEGYMQDQHPKIHHGDYKLFMPDVVSKFDVGHVDTFLQLINFSIYMYNFDTPDLIYITDALMKALKERILLDSEQAMHLLAHVNLVCTKNGNENKALAPDDAMLLANVLSTLSNFKPLLYEHFQGYIENEDNRKLINLFARNVHLISIVAEFITWYYEGDSKRAHALFAFAAKKLVIEKTILSEMYKEMVRLQQIHTFEAFILFKEIRKHNLDLHVPECVRPLLSSLGYTQQVRLLNKFFDTPMYVENRQILCPVSKVDGGEHACTVFVDPDTAFTCFAFKCGAIYWNLDCSTSAELVSMSRNTKWKIKPVDEHYVKIFTMNDTFLTVGEPFPEDQTKRIVYLLKENNSDMQLWKIEAVENSQ